MSRGYTLRYSIVQFAKETDGIRKPKHELKKQYGGVSPFIHSYGTKTRYFGIINEFVEWLISKGIKRVARVSPDTVIEFLEQKVPRVTRKTMKTNIAALRKFLRSSPWQSRWDLIEALDKNYHYLLDLATESGEAIPFSNPERVIERIKEPQHKAIATIQLETGARIDDVPKVVDHMRKWRPGHEFKIIIKNSKGGRDRPLDFNERIDKFMNIHETAGLLSSYIDKKGWKTIKEEYYPDLREAVSALKETYSGSHAFRVNYAQRRHQELLERGLSEKEALKIVTEELGHNRPSMAKAYVYR